MKHVWFALGVIVLGAAAGIFFSKYHALGHSKLYMSAATLTVEVGGDKADFTGVVPYELSELLSGRNNSQLMAGQNLYFFYDGASRLRDATVDTVAQPWSFQARALSSDLDNALTAKNECGSAVNLAVDAFHVPVMPHQIVTVNGVTEDTELNIVNQYSCLGRHSMPTLIGVRSLDLNPGGVLVVNNSLVFATIKSINSNKLFLRSTPRVLTLSKIGKDSINFEIENHVGILFNIVFCGYVNVGPVMRDGLLAIAEIAGYADDKGIHKGVGIIPVFYTGHNAQAFNGAISVSLNSVKQVAIYIAGIKSGGATVDATRLAWNYVPVLEGGEHTITARVENANTAAAGNFSSSITYQESINSIFIF